MSHLCSLRTCSMLFPYSHHHNIHLCSRFHQCRSQSHTLLGQPQFYSRCSHIHRCPNNNFPRGTWSLAHVCCTCRKHQKLRYRLCGRKRKKNERERKKSLVCVTKTKTHRQYVYNHSPGHEATVQHFALVQLLSVAHWSAMCWSTVSVPPSQVKSPGFEGSLLEPQRAGAIAVWHVNWLWSVVDCTSFGL